MENKQELISMIGELPDEQLDEFAADMLDGMTFAHNAGPDTKRKKMLAYLEQEEAPAKPAAETVEQEPEPVVVQNVETKTEPQAAPNVEPEPSKASAAKPKQRMLKNTKNGRLFAYNEKLAKCKHIVFAPEE